MSNSNKPSPPPNIDELIQNAFTKAFEDAQNFSTPEEKKAYFDRIGDDDFLPAIFCETQEELDRTGMTEALTSLKYDGEDAGRVILDLKKKGNDAFANGRRNVKENMQYYRDAINFYLEAIAWSNKLEEEMEENKIDKIDEQNEEEFDMEVTNSGEEKIAFTKEELDEMRSTLYSNLAMAHLLLKNWGFARDNAKISTEYNHSNVKAWYRLAKSHQMLKHWEAAGNAIDEGLKVSNEENNKELTKLSKALSEKIKQARKERRAKERIRLERMNQVKQVWKHCKNQHIKLGRIPLLSIEDIDEENEDFMWKYHFPHTGILPSFDDKTSASWSWPTLFIYPTHQQSDFVQSFNENDMIALRLAEMFPEVEDGGNETGIPWDFDNQFICSNLEIYCEVHSSTSIHPESIQLLQDQESTIKCFESCRAFQGEEGPDMKHLVQLLERKRLKELQAEWKRVNNHNYVGYLDPCPVLRIHPAASLKDVLTDTRVIVPNFVVTLFLFPSGHITLEKFLKDHKCIGVIQPK